MQMNQPEVSTNNPSLTIEDRIKLLADLLLEIIIEQDEGEDEISESD